MPRVTSAINRILRRGSSYSDSTHGHLKSTHFSPSFTPPTDFQRGGSMRISDQVIQELDEQLTISQLTQSKINNMKRPNLMNVFTISDEVPDCSDSEMFPHFHEDDDVFKISPAASVFEEEDDDEFEKLRRKRAEERKHKAALRLARSISAQPGDSVSMGDPKSPTSIQSFTFATNTGAQVAKFSGN